MEHASICELYDKTKALAQTLSIRIRLDSPFFILIDMEGLQVYNCSTLNECYAYLAGLQRGTI